MSNIIDFKINKSFGKKPVASHIKGISEEEYAVSLLRLHRLEGMIQDLLSERVRWMNEPSDPRIILQRMETVYELLSGQRKELPIKPLGFWEKVKYLWN